MSAWICSNRHINIVVTAYAAIAGITSPAELQRLAVILLDENYKSVNYRYGRDDVPGPIVYRNEPVPPMGANLAARCLDYQSCEHAGWETSEAHAVVLAVAEGTPKCDEHAAFPWGYPPYDNEAACTDNPKAVEPAPVPEPDKPMPKIKFRKFFCERDGIKCKVYYWATARSDGSVTVHAKQYGHDLADIFDGVAGITYRNDTDSQTDYFEKSSVTIPVGHPLYAEVRALCKD